MFETPSRFLFVVFRGETAYRTPTRYSGLLVRLLPSNETITVDYSMWFNSSHSAILREGKLLVAQPNGNIASNPRQTSSRQEV